MAVEGGGIVQDRLTRHLDVEHFFHNSRCFPGCYGERDIERKNKAENVFGVIDFRKINRRRLWSEQLIEIKAFSEKLLKNF